MSPVRTARVTATVALAATLLAAAAWLGPGAGRQGWTGIAMLALALTPLALGLGGLLRGKLRTGRWLSLLLPFYGAGFLVGAAGDPAARGWTTLGAFCVALAFAATLSWVKRSAQAASPR